MSERSLSTSHDNHAVPSGSVWAVHVQPQFAEQVYEAAQLLTRPAAPPPTSGPAKASAPTEFALGLKQKALAAAPPPQPPQAQVDGDEDAEPVAERQQTKADTEEVREKKRKVVEELWTKVRPGCFGRADDRGASWLLSPMDGRLKSRAELDAVNNLLIALLVGTFPPSQVRPFASELLEALSAAEGRVTPYGRYNA